jgi:hypothetical protein
MIADQIQAGAKRRVGEESIYYLRDLLANERV